MAWFQILFYSLFFFSNHLFNNVQHNSEAKLPQKPSGNTSPGVPGAPWINIILFNIFPIYLNTEFFTLC